MRLLVVRLIAQHELTTEQIARAAGVSRKSVFNYRDLVVRGGVTALLMRDWAGGPTPAVRGAVAEEFTRRLEAGQFRQARDAQAWIKKRTRKTLSVSGALKVLRRLGGKLKTPRKSHAKKDPAQAAQFKVELPARLTEIVVLFTPAIDRDIHALFLQQIADSDPQALHVVIADQAGFHLPTDEARLPSNLRLLPLPPYCPELNPVERFGGLVKAVTTNRLYPSLRRLEDHIAAAVRPWSTPSAVASLIHQWLADQVNAGGKV